MQPAGFGGYEMPPPPSYMSTHSPMHVIHASREEILEGRIVALTKENERLRMEALGKSHSRTSSMGGPPPKSPAHQSEGPSTPQLHVVGPRRSEDDMLNLSSSQYGVPHLAGAPHGGEPSPAYTQLYQEYRRVCQELSSISRSSSMRGASSSLTQPPPPPQGDFGPAAVAYWNQHANLQSAPQAPSVATPTNPSPAAPNSPKVLPQASPTNRGPSKLAAPPASTQIVKKVSKKQQEVNADNMSKEAYITHLERLIQQKDDMLSKYEGRGPEMLDSAVQATVWTLVAKTQTTEDDMGGGCTPEADSTSSSSSTHEVVEDAKGLLLDARQALVVNGFTTLRPLTLQLCLPNCGLRQTSSCGSPQPTWQHRPYTNPTATGVSKTPHTNPSTPHAPIVELAGPSGSLRWADEPCDLDLAPPTPQLDRRNASVSGANASTSSQRADSQMNLSASRVGSGGAWRGGSRVAARQGSASQTL